jgi:hypothetical protein
MEDWTIGFRHGAATAKASGLRELVTIPVYWGPNYNPSVSNAGPELPRGQLSRPPDPVTTPKPDEPTKPDEPKKPEPLPTPAPEPRPEIPVNPTPITPPAPPPESPKPMGFDWPAPPVGRDAKKLANPAPADAGGNETKRTAAKPKAAPKPPINPGEKPSVPPASADEPPPQQY